MGSGSDWPELAPLQQDLLQRLPAHVLHHDVAGRLAGPAVGVLHEVVHADDVRVLDLGQEPPLGDRRLLGPGVAAVEQALEHDPAVAEVMVHGQVDPAEPAVGQAAEHLVLPGHQLAAAPASGRTRTGCRSSGRTPRPAPAGRPGCARPGGRTRRRIACPRRPAGWPARRRPGPGPAPAGSRPARRPGARETPGCCRAGGGCRCGRCPRHRCPSRCPRHRCPSRCPRHRCPSRCRGTGGRRRAGAPGRSRAGRRRDEGRAGGPGTPCSAPRTRARRPARRCCSSRLRWSRRSRRRSWSRSSSWPSAPVHSVPARPAGSRSPRPPPPTGRTGAVHSRSCARSIARVEFAVLRGAGPGRLGLVGVRAARAARPAGPAARWPAAPRRGIPWPSRPPGGRARSTSVASLVQRPAARSASRAASRPARPLTSGGAGSTAAILAAARSRAAMASCQASRAAETAAATTAIRWPEFSRSAASSAARATAAAARCPQPVKPRGVHLAALPQRQRIGVHHLAQLAEVGLGQRERAAERVVVDPARLLPRRAEVGRHLLQLVGHLVPDVLGRRRPPRRRRRRRAASPAPPRPG